MRIHISGVYVDDQLKAKAFYTDILGFQVKHEVPIGDDWWLTVVSPEDPEGTEFLLEPSGGHAAVKPYREALKADGIPMTQFAVDDVPAEHERLVGLGVEFTMPPTEMGEQTMAVFDDTCGNLIMIIQGV